MTDEKTAYEKKHSLILADRRELSLSGVVDVSGFDDQSVILETTMGELAVRGSDLHINKFSVETGELSLDGSVSSLTYSESRKPESGFFKKFFR